MNEIVAMPANIQEFSGFLNDFNVKRVANKAITHVIIDAANAFRQQQILQAIRDAHFNQQNYHYIMANYVGAHIIIKLVFINICI